MFRFINSKNVSFFLQPEGGFGHTILTPLILTVLFKNKWKLIFGYTNKRHNFLITSIFKNNFFFFRYKIFPVFNLKMNIGLFSIIYFFLEKILRKKVFNFVDVLDKFPLTKKNTIYLSRNPDIAFLRKMRLFQIIIKNKHNFDLPDDLNLKYTNILNNIGGNSFDRRILLIFRRKCSFESTEINRNSPSVINFKKLILELIKNNHQVFIGGDEFSYPEWLNNLAPSVITRKNTILEKDDYRLFVGMTSHGIIGSESGASLYGLLNKKRKILLLENTIIGSAFPNSIVSYPKIYFKSIKEFKNIILNYPLHSTYSVNNFLDKSKVSLSNLEPNHIRDIGLDFVNNLNNNDYGIKPEKYGINNGLLSLCKARFSPVWLKIIGL